MVRAGDRELYVETLGEGRTLVLLHAGAGAIEDLDGLRTELVADHRVVAYDRQGHGRSRHVAPLDYEDLTGELLALLDALELSRADLVGWGDGAIIALLAGLRAPDRVASITAISGNVRGEHLAPGVEDFIRTATPDDLPIPDGYQDSPDGVDHWPVVAEESLALWRTGPQLDVEDLRALRMRVLYLCGDHDLVDLQHTLRMYRATPDALLGVVPRAGHAVPQSHPQILAAFIREALGEEPD